MEGNIKILMIGEGDEKEGWGNWIMKGNEGKIGILKGWEKLKNKEDRKIKIKIKDEIRVEKIEEEKFGRDDDLKMFGGF